MEEGEGEGEGEEREERRREINQRFRAQEGLDVLLLAWRWCGLQGKKCEQPLGAAGSPGRADSQ